MAKLFAILTAVLTLTIFGASSIFMTEKFEVFVEILEDENISHITFAVDSLPDFSMVVSSVASMARLDFSSYQNTAAKPKSQYVSGERDAISVVCNHVR